MSWFHMLLTLGAVAAVVWAGRYVPLSGVRRWIVTACRAASVVLVMFALWGPSQRRVAEVPRHLIYLVDRSLSIDDAQQAWMARRIASLEAVRPPRLERAIMAFGADANVAVPLGREPLTDPDAILRRLDATEVNRSRTNLESAVLSALSLVPQGHRGGVVLLSDGRETQGNVGGVLAYARRLGLEVFPVSPPMTGKVKTVWEELVVSPVVQRGSPVAVQLVVFNGASQTTRGQVTIALEGVPITRERTAIRPGWQVVTLSVPSLRRGTMALDVELAIPDEGLREHRPAYAEVEGPPQVLFVTEQLAALPTLVTALKRRAMEVSVIRPSELPGEPQSVARQLLDHDAVVLFNIPKSALSTVQVGVLRTYLEHGGGGLVMVGLGGDLAEEIQTPVPLDELLPVRFEPKGLQEAKRRVCMMMLIDRSASMLGPRIAATKRAAVELIKQLSPEDLVGVLAFDTKPYVVVEVQQAGQVGAGVVEKLVKLRSSGGTDVLPALLAARDRLDLTGATLKHIILLSDGNTPFEEKAYKAFVESCKLSGISISTIGIGAVFVNTDFLRWLSLSTGGSFYQLRDLDELPQLVARDTKQELGRLPFTEGLFQPKRAPTTPWFTEITDWPSLRGYLTTTAKPGADVDLTVDGGAGEDPLVARWTVGTGRVVSFTSDADSRWSPAWIRWPGFEGTWAQIVRWAMRPRLAEEVFVWMDESRGAAQLILEGALREPTAELISAQQESATPLSLIQTGPFRWSASLEQIPSGWYQLVLASRQDSAPVFVKRWVQIGTPPTLEEIPGQPPRESVLRQIARSTSGVYEAPDRSLLPLTTRSTTTQPIFHWWLPLVIVLLLVEVALRGSSML